MPPHPYDHQVPEPRRASQNTVPASNPVTGRVIGSDARLRPFPQPSTPADFDAAARSQGSQYRQR
jgi:hypothetical protein